jgi:hypothetical protein
MTVKQVIKRFLAAAMVLGFGVLLGSCSDVSGYLADHWPHWAGGLPEDVPPRPGTPGYDDFIAHGQINPDAAKPVAPVAKTAATNVKTTARPAPVAPDTPPGDRSPEDTSVVQGGLY